MKPPGYKSFQVGLSILLLATALSAQTFEVASIKQHVAAFDRPVLKNPDLNPIHISGTRVTLEMVSLKGLVMAAYNVKEYQVSGGPTWASQVDSMYDIAARTPMNAAGDAPPSMDGVRAMLQNLLADRFHLKLNRETKTLPVYSLVVARSGLKMKPAAPDSPAPAPGMRRGTVDQLAALLSLMLARPVIDKTGLTGVYEYSTGFLTMDSGTNDPQETIAKTLSAMQDQLGLKVDSTRGPVEILVIDSADRPSQD